MNVEIDHEQLRSKPIGEIAAALPGATAIFRKFNLDFCCGGDIALGDATSKRGLEFSEVAQALAAIDPEGQTSAPTETEALIDHILSRYHETHRRELPELVRLARKVEKVHHLHPKAPHGLADLLEAMIGELEVHMKKEELILFPAMQRQGSGKFDAPITQMRHDHDDHGQYLRQIEKLTENFQLPDGACRTWQALYKGAEKLVDDLTEHVHLENNVLFPRFETKALG